MRLALALPLVVLLGGCTILSDNVVLEPDETVAADRLSSKWAEMEATLAGLEARLAATETDLADTRYDLAAAEAELAALQDEDVALQAAIDATDEDVAGLGSDLAALRARVTANEDGLAALPVAPVGLIEADLTLDVPGAFADIPAALDWLDGWLIATDATVTIQVAPGAYTHSAPIEVAHPDGDRIWISGDPANPTTVQITFDDTDGFVVSKARALGRLEGLQLIGTGVGGENHAVAASDSGYVKVADLVISGFTGAGLYASREGVVQAIDDSIAVSGCTWGYAAFDGGNIRARGSTATNNVSHGYTASRHSFIRAEECTATGNGGTGYSTNLASVIYATEATADANYVGFAVNRNSTIQAAGATVSNNTTWGATANWAGDLEFGGNQDFSNNGMGSTTPPQSSGAENDSSDIHW